MAAKASKCCRIETSRWEITSTKLVGALLPNAEGLIFHFVLGGGMAVVAVISDIGGIADAALAARRQIVRPPVVHLGGALQQRRL